MATQSDEPTGPDLAEGVPMASLPDGGMISGHVGKEPVLLARIGQGIFAIGSKCTHYGGPLGEGVVSGETVRCPWHHACFSLRTGEAVRAPAFDPVPRWRVDHSGDRIIVREKFPKARRKQRPLRANSLTALASSSLEAVLPASRPRNGCAARGSAAR